MGNLGTWMCFKASASRASDEFGLPKKEKVKFTLQDGPLLPGFLTRVIKRPDSPIFVRTILIGW